VGFFAVLPMASPASSFSRSALRAREALVRSAPRCRSGEPAAPYLRRCISGVPQHHLRDQISLVRVSRGEVEKGACPFSHASLDAPAAGWHSLLEQLASPEHE
jgi:hypothetical protein